jgi:hypothetical protein
MEQVVLVSKISFELQLKFEHAVPTYGDPRQYGVLGPYEDTSSICRACIQSGAGTNEDSFYCTITISEPAPFYKDPGGGSMRYSVLVIPILWILLNVAQTQNDFTHFVLTMAVGSDGTQQTVLMRA